MRLAGRMSRLAPSATMAVDSLAKQMAREGVDVVNFGAGEPDFDTPEAVKAACQKALAEGKTKYLPAAGLPELREAVCRKFARDNDLHYQPEQVVITVGAKHALFNLFQVLLDPGDEVIIPAPYWVSYVDQTRFAGGEAVIVDGPESQGFKITADQLRKAVTPRTRAVVLNSPSNPTGAVYTAEELAELAKVIVEHDLVAISDEIYEPFIYDGGKHFSIAQASRSAFERTVLVHGVSKSHAMTGWRIGFVAGPPEIIKGMISVQSQSTSNATSIAQWAALEALTGDYAPVERMVEEFSKRRRYVVDRLRELPGMECSLPQGAFYVFPNVSAAFGRRFGGQTIENSMDFSQRLLQEAHVALVPGSAFGLEGHVRISYAASMESLEKGLDRLSNFWNRLE